MIIKAEVGGIWSQYVTRYRTKHFIDLFGTKPRFSRKVLDDLTGVEALKRVTRKYARKQVRWLNNRLLKRSPDNTPPVYALDATDVTHWQNKVHNPAVEVLQAMMKDEIPAIPTAPHLEEPKNKHVLNVCDICDGIILVTEKDFKIHMASRKHKKNLARKKALELKNQEIEKEKQRDVIQEETH